MSKNYIVTGGSGFIGSRVAELLINQNHNVIVIDKNGVGTWKGNNIQLISEDLSDPNYDFSPFFRQADGVFHLAANPSVQDSIRNPLGTNIHNVDATLRVLEYGRQFGIGRVVFSSSSAVYGNTDALPSHEDCVPNPISPYALQKLICEQYCKLYSTLYGIETVSLRYFNVYGDGLFPNRNSSYSSVLNTFRRQKAQGQPLTITGDGKQRRDFVHVEDVARMNLIAMTSSRVGAGEVINVGTGKSYSVAEIAEAFDTKKVFVPALAEPKESLCCTKRAFQLGWMPSHDLIRWLKSNV